MAAKKYISLVLGKLKEIAATVVSLGAANDGDLVALDPTGRLDNSVMPIGIGPLIKVLPASEILAAGDFVNIWNDGGTIKVRKADAAAANKFRADGYVLEAVAAPGDDATVYLEDLNTKANTTGFAGGDILFLSATTPGKVTNVAPVGSGDIVQQLGTVTVVGNPGEMTVEMQQTVELA